MYVDSIIYLRCCRSKVSTLPTRTNATTTRVSREGKHLVDHDHVGLTYHVCMGTRLTFRSFALCAHRLMCIANEYTYTRNSYYITLLIIKLSSNYFLIINHRCVYISKFINKGNSRALVYEQPVLWSIPERNWIRHLRLKTLNAFNKSTNPSPIHNITLCTYIYAIHLYGVADVNYTLRNIYKRSLFLDVNTYAYTHGVPHRDLHDAI